jgi:hypothetical protein
LDKFRYIQSALQEYLNQGNDLGVKVYGEYCTSNDEKDPRRKPNIEMLKRCLIHYLAVNNGWNNLTYIPKSEMIMIGDASGKPGDFSDTDKKTAQNFEIDYIDVNEFVKKYYSE